MLKEWMKEELLNKLMKARGVIRLVRFFERLGKLRLVEKSEKKVLVRIEVKLYIITDMTED